MTARTAQPRGAAARLIPNALSLIGATAATSGLGAVYWWLAARAFAPATVGLASAAISAMLLLGTLGMLGLGTLLTGELPKRRAEAGPLISATLVASGAAAILLGLLFAIAAPIVSAQFAPLGSPIAVAVFAVGVALTSVGLVLDQAVIGLLRGELQLWRNTAASVVKLAALVAAAALGLATGMTVYGTWVLGNLASFGVFAALAHQAGFRLAHRPSWTSTRELGAPALRHHALNMALQGPSLALPVLVAALISASANASFYAAWMIAGFVLVVPQALTTALYAVQAHDAASLGARLRHTLALSLGAGVASALILAFAAHPLLAVFGRAYADQGASSLRLLGLLVFPFIIKAHYVAVARIHGRIGPASVLMMGLGVLELAAAAAGGVLGGLVGLSAGLVVAMTLECTVTVGAVYSAATGKAE